MVAVVLRAKDSRLMWLSEALAQVLNPTSEGPRSSTTVAAIVSESSPHLG